MTEPDERFNDSLGRDDSGDWFAQGFADYTNSFLGQAETVLEAENESRAGRGLEGEWTVYDPIMSPDFLLSCPCGSVIEQDGQCSNGHVSPLRGAGLA